jgi:benzodiazapine receptor
MRTKHGLIHALAAALPVIAALALGQVATYPNLVPWYANLAKPVFTPPNWLFGPVWFALYAAMAVAAWRVLQQSKSSGRSIALLLFFGQLLLNVAWSWMFFAAQSPLLGLLNIVVQFLAIVATLVVFMKLDRVAGWLLVPLAIWVGYAAILNFEIWRLNN